MNRHLYALHRWLSAAALLQLAIWLGSGLFFAAFPIERVRGKGASAPALLSTDDGVGLLGPATALEVASSWLPAAHSLELRRAAYGPVYLVRGPSDEQRIRIEARTGRLLPVDEAEARQVANVDQRRAVDAPVVARAVDAGAPVEVRGKASPLWRVEMRDAEGTVVWIDGWTAEVVARRNDLWRTYDFLWSLHIMDYRERASFHHPLLVAAAMLGLLALASGGVLWLARLARRRRGRKKDGASGSRRAGGHFGR